VFKLFVIENHRSFVFEITYVSFSTERHETESQQKPIRSAFLVKMSHWKESRTKRQNCARVGESSKSTNAVLSIIILSLPSFPLHETANFLPSPNTKFSFFFPYQACVGLCDSSGLLVLEGVCVVVLMLSVKSRSSCMVAILSLFVA